MNKNKKIISKYLPPIIRMNGIKNIHLIGIGGSSMSGIAEILLQIGYNISGSDLILNCITKKLITLGITIFLKHSKKNVINKHLIIISSAILKNNPEIIAAKQLGIPIILRAEIISEIMRYKYSIAISGSHGKTSTTALTFDIFNKSNLYPTLINGGKTKLINNNVILGKNPFYCIVEADESDSSFLHLRPIISVITSIEIDHINNYNYNFDNLKKTFINFIHNLPFYGKAIICIDDKNIRSIVPFIKRKIITYGFSNIADIRISNYKQIKFTSNFTISRKNQPVLNIHLNLPGKHNALNAAAAISIATEENINDKYIIESLKNFQGVERRFELSNKIIISNKLNKKNTIIFINDYGHHPTEIYNSINTARTGWPKRKLLMIFQPHRYTRTQYLITEFTNVLSTVDELFLLKTYSANEKFIQQADSKTLYINIKKRKKNSVTLILNNKDLFNIVTSKLSGNDLILIQGAGDVNKITHHFLIKKFQHFINKKSNQNE